MLLGQAKDYEQYGEDYRVQIHELAVDMLYSSKQNPHHCGPVVSIFYYNVFSQSRICTTCIPQ